MKRVFLTLVLMVLALQVWSADATAAIRTRFAHTFPEVHIASIEPSQIPGWYLVQAEGMAPIFMTADAHYMVQGDFVRFDGDKIVNVSEQAQQKQAVGRLNTIPSSQEIVFTPRIKPKAIVYAFTDIDCGYCRKMHSQMAAYNAMGIEFRYLAWPRTGPDSVTAQQMAGVWCAPDRSDALTHAYMGHVDHQSGSAHCQQLISQEFALGESLGVDGTPALFTTSGERIGGYLSPADLAQVLGLKR